MRLRSINVQVSLLTTCIIAATIAGLVWYVSASTYHVARDLGLQMSRQSVDMATKALDSYMQGAVNKVEALSTQTAITNSLLPGFSAKRAEKTLAEIMSYEKDYWAMFIFDAQGQVVAGCNAEGKSLAGADRASREYVKAILGGKEFYVTRTVLRAKSGEGEHLILGVTKAVKDLDGVVVGGLAVFPRWEVFTERFIDPVRVGQDGYGFIFDSEGRIIAHAVDKELLFKDLSGQEFVKQALSVRNGLVEYDWQGEKKLMAVQGNALTGWVVCMSVYEHDLASGAISQRNVLLAVGLLMIVGVSAVLAALLRRLVFRPLTAIEHYTGEVAEGHLSAALEGVFHHEMHNLAGHVTHMVAELKQKLGFAEGVLTGLTQPCMVVDTEERITFINQPYLDLYERPETPDAIKGMTVSRFFYGQEGRETIAGKCMRENCVMRDHEMESETSKGKALFIRYDVAPLYDLDRNLQGAFLLFFDLTGIRANQALVEEKNAKIERAAAKADSVAEQVVAASEQMAAQVEQSSSGAELQRERASEAATAMEEMNATVLEVARNASEAAGLADQSRDKAQEGAEVVEKMVATIREVHQDAVRLKSDMADLGRQAEGIGQIMNVISDIADQTNLLALNAAIEAARAGDAGRGFAVVADEVRKLAEKTMTATQEVGTSIQAIQKSAQRNIESTEQAAQAIDATTAMADQSGAALREIVGLVERTADQVRGIATASEEQSAASEEISRATAEINQIAMETAQAMHESRQATDDLARIAADLKSVIDDMQN